MLKKNRGKFDGDNRVRSTLGEISEDGVDFRVGAHVQDLNLKSPREARSFNFYRIKFRAGRRQDSSTSYLKSSLG